MRRLSVGLWFLLLAGNVEAQFQEQITVERILIDVRVTDMAGDPVPELTTDDFTVTIGRHRARVESVTWVDDVGGAVPRSSSRSSEEEDLSAPGRNTEKSEHPGVFSSSSFRAISHGTRRA